MTLDDQPPYTLAYRDGTEENWALVVGQANPWLADTRLQYNAPDTAGDWGRVEAAAGTLVNVFACWALQANGSERLMFILGQREHLDRTSAAGELITDLDLGRFPAAELRFDYRLTLQADDGVLALFQRGPSTIVDSPGDTQWHGWPTGAAGERYVTLSYANKQVTLTPTSSNVVFWTFGVKRTILGAFTFAAHDAAAGGYFFYFDKNGAAKVGTGAWDILSDIPTAYVYWDGTTGILFNELHGYTRDLATHKRLHTVDGTQVVSGFALGGYTPTPAVPATGDNTFSVATGVIADEDVTTSVTAVADGGPYCVVYRNGASGPWTINTGNSVPYKAGTYVQYNLNTAGTWSLADLGANEYVNWYVAAIPAVTATYQIILVPAQAKHSTLASAQAESFASLDWGTLPFQEIAILYRVTFRTGAGYGSTGKCRIESVTRQIGSQANINLGTTAFQPLDGDLTAIAALASTGLLERTGTDTWQTNSFAIGSYTPTWTYTAADYDTFSARDLFYIRIGEFVLVSGTVAIKKKVSGQIDVGCSLPIASSLVNNYDATGVASAAEVAGNALNGTILADGTNDRVRMVANVTATEREITLMFMYKVI